ncbi:MAG: DUF5678 domain-containing protein [Candidatus Thermoplasmatota archaeon]|nr:DUF5678 domain-containing protein [Candidatus Thermoplasmatota archaeon]
MVSEQEWFARHAKELKKYEGKYVAVIDDKIVASSPNAGEAIENARKAFPDKVSLLIYVPREKELEMLI